MVAGGKGDGRKGRYVRELDRRYGGREFDETLLMRLQIGQIP